MLQTCSLLTFLHIGTTLSQYMDGMGMRADMTFDEDNDRFDVGNIIKEQNKAYKESSPMEDDYRRRERSDYVIPLYEVIKYNRRQNMANQSKRNRAINRRNNHNEDQHFDNGEDAYNRNLAKFKAVNGRKQMQVIDLEQYLAKKREDQTPIKHSNRRAIRYRRHRGGEANVNDIELDKINEKKEYNNVGDIKLKRDDIGHKNAEVDEKQKIHDAVLKYLHPDAAEHNTKKRKVTDEENLLLLHSAVPINLEVNGYLEVPPGN